MRHRGVTKVEVAVVLSIVAIALGLLSSAVRKVRDAAARATCAGHLCQLALSAHNYASVEKDTLPPGCLPGAGTPPERLSWCIAVLPYIEEQKTYQNFLLDAGPLTNSAATVPVKMFVCPGAGKKSAVTQHYIGVAGAGADAATLPTDHPRAGAFGYDRRVRLDDFKDGKSYTLLFAEIHTPVDTWATGGPATVRPAAYNEFYPGIHGPGTGFLPSRTTTVVFAMVDGSICYVRHTVGPEILAAMATAAGSEKAEWPD